jgi:phosphatidylglycerophosphate synthase
VIALAAGAVLLAVLAFLTARRPERGVLDRDGYLDRWQRLHGGYDPRSANVWVRGWLAVVHRTARPLARRGVHPDVVTVASLWLALAVLVPASAGGHWPVLAGLVLAGSGMLDALDGCVAVLQRRTTRWGYVLDSLVDRLSDVVYLAAAVAVGAPPVLAVVVGVAVFLLEYVRARAGNAGGDDVGRVTAGERPIRVILLSASMVVSGLVVAHSDLVVTVGLSVLAAVTALGTGQLVVAVRRQLLALPADDEQRPATTPAGG